MKKSLPYIVAAAAAVLIAAAPNWAGMTTLGTGGSHVIGNPKAKVRVVEYFSYTCSHCAHFSEDAAPQYRKGALARGEAAYELRHVVRDRIDLAAAVVARCGGPAKFAGNSEAIMAAQHDWLPKGAAYDAKNGARLAKLPPGQGIQQIVNGIGLNTIMMKRGFTQAQVNACAANPATMKTVVAMAQDSSVRAKVPYTPYFVINGQPAENISKWAQIESMIQFYLTR